ncbi:MAG: DUF2924 domain-containing protein [Alphaproteobacteria bacterium]|nr:DUF2924 domain-containing protein [Alphaproteobacteria bacterium]
MSADQYCTTVTAQNIDALESLGLYALRAVWREHVGEPPILRSASLLRALLAWRLQEAAFGGLDAETRRRLKAGGRQMTEGLDLGDGAQIKREWRGQIETVVVEADGFRWRERTYKSLSAVATAMTGTQWNGPRFFGLRSPGNGARSTV